MKLGLSRDNFLVLAVLTCGSFVTLLNQTLITPALSTIMAEFAIDTATVQWLVNSFTIVNAIMVPLTAHFIENYSTRTLFVSAMGAFLLGSLLAAWGPSFFVLLMGRVFQAAGAGVLMPMCMTELMTSFPVEHRGQAMGVFGLVNSVGPVAGPTLSGIVIDHFNWHVLFCIVSVLAVLGIIAGFVALKRTGNHEKQRKGHLDKVSVITSSLGLATLLYGFSAIGSDGLSPLVALSILAGLIILVVFVRRQLSMEEPMLKIGILKNKRFAIATIVVVALQPALMCGPILIPIFIQTTLGYSATTSGLIMIPGAVLMAILNPVVGRMFDQHGPRTLALVGGVVTTLATIPMCFFNLNTPLWVICLCMALRHGAVALINMPVSTWGMNALDDELMAHGSSISNTTRMVAGSLGTAVIVSISTVATGTAVDAGLVALDAAVVGFNVAFGFSAIICCLVASLCFFFVKSNRAHEAAADEGDKRRITLTQIMKTDVYMVFDTATVAEACALFVEKGVSAMPIVNKKGQAVGFISDGDLLRALTGDTENQTYVDPVTMLIRSGTGRGISEGFDERLNRLMELPVTAIAHMGIITVDVHDRLSVVCRVLGENHLKKVPVVDNGKVVGIINRSDITKFAMMQYMNTHEAVMAHHNTFSL